MINNDYIVKKVFRRYLLFSILSAVASPLGVLVDGIIVGNFYGKEAMAAIGLVSPIYLLLSAFSGIIASGSISLSGQYIGKEQPEMVKRIFSLAMRCSIAIYLFCMVSCLFCPEQLAQLLGASGSLLPLTTSYIRGLGAGIGLNVLHLVLIEFTKLDGSPALGPLSIAAMTAVHIILDLVNVFWLHMGLFGIALATSISFLVGVLVCCIHFFKPVNTLRLVSVEKPYHHLAALCKSGLPRGGNGICFAVTIALINHQLLFLGGSAALAAFSIQNSVALVVGSTCLGIGATTLMLSGIFCGEEDKKALENTVKVSLREGVLLTALVCGLCFVLLNPIISLFGQTDPNVTAMAFAAVGYKLVGLVIFTVNHVFVNYYQGAGNLKMANFVSVTEALPAQAIYILVLPLFIGVNGVWLSAIFGGITTFLALTIVVCWQNRRFPRSLKEYLLFPKNFGVEDSMQLNVSISNDLCEVVDISRQVYAFCEKQGIDARRTHHLSLCVEEMVGNVVRYGFTDKKTHYIDIRILQKEGQLLFRLRDDGIPFNPLSSRLGQGEALGKNIGVHLVRGLSNFIDYRYTVGLNNLLIKL